MKASITPYTFMVPKYKTKLKISDERESEFK